MIRSYKWVPVVEEDLCTGCGVCIEACGPACLEFFDGVAILARPDACGSEEHCIASCPEECIYMDWMPMQGDHSVGKWK